MKMLNVVVVLAMSGCTAANKPELAQVYHFPSGEDSASCKRTPGPGYSDPADLAHAYVTRDGADELYANGGSWLPAHLLCPGHPSPGWDVVPVVSQATIDSVTVAGPVARAYISYHRLGFAQGNPAGFTEALDNTIEVLQMVHLTDGWWVNSATPPHPLASTILARFDWPDSVRAVIEQLARDSSGASEEKGRSH